MKKERARRVYHVYAIRLDDEVLEIRKFAKRNPGYRPGKPCYYTAARREVGVTPGPAGSGGRAPAAR